MRRRRALVILNTAFQQMQKPYYQGEAAELAFFFLLSMVPLSIVLANFLGLFSLSGDVVQNLLDSYVTPELVGTLRRYISYRPSGTFNFVFIVLALWAASKAQFSMIRIANYTYTGNNAGRGYVWERIRAIFTVVLTILALGFALVILVYGRGIATMVEGYLNTFLKMNFHFQEFWFFVRWPFALAFYFLAISLIYYFLPTVKLKYKEQLPGVVLSSIGFLLVTFAYSFYLSNFSNYGRLYGSLGAVVGLLMWFWLIGFVLVIGIVFNEAWRETETIRAFTNGKAQWVERIGKSE